MTRKWIDRRGLPDESGCTLYLSREDHGTAAAAEHGISSQRAEDTRSYGSGFAASRQTKPK